MIFIVYIATIGSNTTGRAAADAQKGTTMTETAKALGGFDLDDHEIVNSSFAAIINAPIDTIDLPKWAFTLPEHEYLGCSPAHVAAGFTTAPDGKRMSINVEVIGGVPMVQHTRPSWLR